MQRTWQEWKDFIFFTALLCVCCRRLLQEVLSGFGENTRPNRDSVNGAQKHTLLGLAFGLGGYPRINLICACSIAS